MSEECDFEHDIIDRRILYEMINERLHPDDFRDETTDDEDQG